MSRKIALILSGGTGSRLGSDIPKQYIEVGGKPIISYCMQTLVQVVDAIVVVAASEYQELIRDAFDKLRLHYSDAEGVFKGFASPGETRQLSIYNGLLEIKKFASGEDVVLIHDAARPNLTVKMINECFNSIDGHDGVLPVLPMKDTVYLSDDGSAISSLLDRKKIFAGQAPEAFVLGKYIDANERLLPVEILKINGSTEPAILAGLDVVMIPGDEGNYKITTVDDLERFKQSIE